MHATVMTRLMAPFRSNAPRLSNSAAVFNLCPLFLFMAIAALLLAGSSSAAAGLPPPHQSIPLSVFLLGFSFFPFAAAAKPRTARDWMYVVAASLILPLGNAILPWASEQTIRVLPHFYDAHVANLDATLGFQPSFVMGAVFMRCPIIASLFSHIYSAVVLPAALVAALEAQYGCRMGPGALPTFLVIAAVGFVFYHLLPVVGPAPYFGGAFPFATERAYLPAPRNAMPSLHTAWVLMAFLATRGMSRPIRITTGIAAVGTMIATLGLGEHYLTDVVVACPFVLLVRALCAIELPVTARERMTSFLVGAVLLFVWGLAVRGIISPSEVPGLVPVAMLATVGTSFWLEHRLAHASGAFGVKSPSLGRKLARPGWFAWHRRTTSGMGESASI